MSAKPSRAKRVAKVTDAVPTQPTGSKKRSAKQAKLKVSVPATSKRQKLDNGSTAAPSISSPEDPKSFKDIVKTKEHYKPLTPTA